jgi:hypothetical protein
MYAAHRNEVQVVSPRTASSNPLSAGTTTVPFAAKTTHLMIPSSFSILSAQPRLSLGHVLQLKLLEQSTDGLLVGSSGILAVYLLDLFNDLIYDGLRHGVAFERRDRTCGL